MHYENTVDEVDRPVIGDARPRVETRPQDAIGAQTILRDLDHNDRGRWMLAEIVARRARNDRDVGFGLRCVVERDGQLDAH